MIKRLKLIFEDKTIWVILGGSVLFSFALSLLVISIDTRTIPLLYFFPDGMLTSVNLSKEILKLLAGSLFSVATFTFATMLTVISLYSSNFSPRAVENFLLNRTSMETLGTFMGGFIYCLSSLFFMRSSENEHLVLSATVALLYAFACVILFTKFVYNVSNFVQLEKLVNKLYLEAVKVFDNKIAVFQDSPKCDHLPNFSFLQQYTLRAENSAYIEYIDFKQLVQLCEEHQGVLVLYIRIGDFVSERQPIGIFYTNRKVAEDEQLQNRVNRTFTYETEQSAMFDPNFAKKKLTEVALRAVSPGINDPNTAIHIMHYKALLEAKMAAIPGKYAIMGNPAEGTEGGDANTEYVGCCFYSYNYFFKDIQEGYWQLLHYMKEDISGVAAIFDSLMAIAYAAEKDKLRFVKEYSQHVYNLSYPNFTEKLDRQVIDEKHESILAIEPFEEDEREAAE